MNQFMYGLIWGLGFFCAAGAIGVVCFIVLAGLAGIYNISKSVKRPPMPPGA